MSRIHAPLELLCPSHLQQSPASAPGGSPSLFSFSLFFATAPSPLLYVTQAAPGCEGVGGRALQSGASDATCTSSAGPARQCEHCHILLQITWQIGWLVRQRQPCWHHRRLQQPQQGSHRLTVCKPCNPSQTPSNLLSPAPHSLSSEGMAGACALLLPMQYADSEQGPDECTWHFGLSLVCLIRHMTCPPSVEEPHCTSL